MIDKISNYSNIILTGNFNIHVGDEDDAETMAFLDTIEALGLEQWVDEPTHRSDDILGLVISRVEHKTKPVRCTTGGFISDHQAVFYLGAEEMHGHEEERSHVLKVKEN